MQSWFSPNILLVEGIEREEGIQPPCGLGDERGINPSPWWIVPYQPNKS